MNHDDDDDDTQTQNAHNDTYLEDGVELWRQKCLLFNDDRKEICMTTRTILDAND